MNLVKDCLWLIGYYRREANLRLFRWWRRLMVERRF